MKKKTRKMVVVGQTYVYVLNQSYQPEESIITLKISLEGQKNITLSFKFCTWEDAISGSPLYVGIDLNHRVTKAVEHFSLNHPSRIKEFIIYGNEHGWTGQNSMVFHDGLEVMHDMGYDISCLMPKNKRTTFIERY
ncbi:hypothetical protein BVG16_12160 [Paenibacillus selenitireducens]|uniref:Uncharacterized protein n=1 Tax=Paenibacillus selenitireducens TaxID=1324314 RepID=A0A1T2XFL6_9BACL|nr:hypothetical protein [Paenibacillus selenitireducens]OPA78612.1 hypothetical protein BVG16_12160 [Paenibacillus selenitireducens]